MEMTTETQRLEALAREWEWLQALSSSFKGPPKSEADLEKRKEHKLEVKQFLANLTAEQRNMLIPPKTKTTKASEKKKNTGNTAKPNNKGGAPSKKRRDQRREAAQETLEVLNTGQYHTEDGRLVSIEQDLQASVEGTRLYRPADPLEESLIRKATTFRGQACLEVHNETTFAGARALLQRNAARVCVLNFASAKSPGGGFLNGAKAQEEDLALRSGLYACLSRGNGVADYYTENQTTRDGIYTHHMIYSPDVPVFREDGEVGRFLEVPCQVSIITSPAPNATVFQQKNTRVRSKKHVTKQTNPPDDMPAEYWQIFQERIRHVLHVAIANGHSNLVLGAWGCGVFGNDPAKVAQLFATELQAVAGHLEAVRFSIWAGDRVDDPNLVAFQRQFA
ncbi:Uncharacterized protein conserved in bacteria (DUF2263) [Seminavis robusta]|uniref:Uncharacterized protein conserved in bacteria (DUF2263) n=1 Tax=Seminavis robusta TaxID=568900 RepID=A0A9N8EPZ9_9STRA|nr:Uncharacterized protein conserved in bacteria (DUF2263) [Seminavis robusta]|eukprot:Sro1639_g287850.1 Uncharacterized protein conserved in bacteria (DUF2263) (393) ;mRNA; r:18093-19271